MPYKDMVRGSGFKKDMASALAQIGARQGGWVWICDRKRQVAHT